MLVNLNNGLIESINNQILPALLVRTTLIKYYVSENAQPNGDHEVHRTGCLFLPEREDRVYLGDFRDCRSAIREAMKYYDQVNGCYFCARECHTQ